MIRADRCSARVDEMGWGRVQHRWMNGVRGNVARMK
jgi:hypothetical protein